MIRRVLTLLLLSLGLASGPAVGEEVGIELRFLNGSYSDLDGGLAPIREGPLTIGLSSPEHQLIVHRNRLSLMPGEDGLLDGLVEVELEGSGRLIADVSGAGIENRFVDEVSAPRQTVRAGGWIRLEKTVDGYLFTVVCSGEPIRIAIDSGVARQVVGICRTLAILPLLDLGCDRLERSLSVVGIASPEPGARFLLPRSYLDADERAFFDQLLNGSAARFAPPGGKRPPVPDPPPSRAAPPASRQAG